MPAATRVIVLILRFKCGAWSRTSAFYQQNCESKESSYDEEQGRLHRSEEAKRNCMALVAPVSADGRGPAQKSDTVASEGSAPAENNEDDEIHRRPWGRKSMLLQLMSFDERGSGQRCFKLLRELTLKFAEIAISCLVSQRETDLGRNNRPHVFLI